MSHPPSPAIVLFDGVCNLCTWSVQFIIQRDPAGYFHFASLQSPVGAKTAVLHGIESNLRSIVLIENGRAVQESEAVLRILEKLPGYRAVALIARIVPRIVRDPIYRLVARYRYRIFGRKESCMIPTPQLAARFLTDTPESSPHDT